MQSQKRKEGSKAGEVVQSKKSRKKKAQISADLEEERRLTALLFGTSTSASASSLPIRAVDGDAGGRDASGLRSYDKSALESHFKSQGTRTNDLGDDGDDASRPLFEIDRAGVPEPSGMQGLREKSRQMDPKVNEDVSGTSDHDEDGDRSIGSLNPAEAAPAWQDDDDENVQVNLMESSMRLRKLRTSQSEAVDALPGRDLEARLRNRFQSTAELTARTDWARVNDRAVGDDNENADGTPESSSLSLFGGPSIGRKLPGGAINMVRCRDANQSDPNRSVVQAVHFHPASDAANPLLLTAGLDKTLRFFQVGVEKSTKVHGIHFPKLPIYSASFLGTTGNVIVGGRRPFFYIYDAASGGLDYIPRVHAGRHERSLERFATSPDGRTVAFMGNDGYIILFDAARKRWITDLKMNGSVRAITFTPSGDQIITSGSDGDVYRWDLRNACRCVERFSNEDGTITSYLAASSRHLAVGAESGVVNLYSELNASASSKRTPIKSILNLHTSADMLRFNSDGQILAMSSRRETNGLKLLHVPTATVFSNWPTSKTPLSYVWSHDFSPESRYFAAGNDKGNCLLYRLTHYDSDA